MIVQHYSSHNYYDGNTLSHPKAQYTVRDITYSILESTRDVSTGGIIPSSHGPSIQEIALEKSTHDWNTDDTIRAIQKGEFELPLKKFEEVYRFVDLSSC